MQIPWKTKSKIFGLIDLFRATPILYFIQKNVTKRSLITKLKVESSWVRHRDALTKFLCCEFVFEFGGGKSLAQNLYLSSVVKRQLVVDLNPMLDIQLVEKSRELLACQVKLESDAPIKSLEDLKKFNIEYKAPYDASKLDLESSTLDACITTNTLEHISRKSIKAIFLELNRVLKDAGIVSAQIDCSDHYAHTDSNITLLNFLNFTDSKWKSFNHNCHYQNRLRHYDYKELFEECGFYIVSEDLFFDEDLISDSLRQKFKDKPPTWHATSVHFVLRKKI